MPKLDYDDPEIEERWCAEHREIVAAYLRSQAVKHGRIGEWPAWHVAPCASIWAIESSARPESIGWWVICGDLPIDYISAADVETPQHPRKAMRVFAKKWLEVVNAWKNGREIENTRIGALNSHEQLRPLLESRAVLLAEWVADDLLWDEHGQ